MATTTVTAIRAALETTIAGFTCAGAAMGTGSYAVASGFEEWSERNSGDVDRQFSIGSVDPSNPLEFGVTSEVLLDGSMELEIGHMKSGDVDSGRDRRDDDVAQLATELISKVNYPSGVYLIEVTGVDHEDYEEEFWISTITFRLMYARAT